MKQYFFPAVMMTMVVLMTACSADEVPEAMPEPSKTYQKSISRNVTNAKTVLVYIAGNNNLNLAIDSDLKEMKEGSKRLKEDESLLVFVRRDHNRENPWFARIKNGIVTDSVSISDMGINSSDGQNRASDPAVMEGVIRYAFNHYAAASNYYGLVLWGHGSGWLIEQEVKKAGSRGFGMDYGNSNENKDIRWMNMTTMANLLKGLPHLKFIMGDCCHLMCLENLYELRNTCDYIIGSPAEIPDYGAPYDQIVPDMFADGQFYSNIVNKYHTSVGGKLPLAAVQTSEMENLAQATREPLKAIKAKLGNDYADMTGIIHYYHSDNSDQFLPEHNIFYDAGDFIRTHAPQDVYAQWKQALDKAVVASRTATIWATNKLWSKKYSDFKVTEEKMHCVSMFVKQDPAKGYYAKYNEDIKQLSWYNAAGLNEIGW